LRGVCPPIRRPLLSNSSSIVGLNLRYALWLLSHLRQTFAQKHRKFGAQVGRGFFLGQVLHFSSVRLVIVQFHAVATVFSPFGVPVPRRADAVAGTLLRQCGIARSRSRVLQHAFQANSRQIFSVASARLAITASGNSTMLATAISTNVVRNRKRNQRRLGEAIMAVFYPYIETSSQSRIVGWRIMAAANWYTQAFWRWGRGRG